MLLCRGRGRFALILLLLASQLVGCSTGGVLRGGAVAVASPDSLAPPDMPELVSSELKPPYRIGPQDLLDIKFLGVPELDRTVRVDRNGSVSVPLGGTVQAAGRSVQEFELAIASALGGRYLQDPQVSVFVKEASRLNVTVDGSVTKPGVYPIAGDITLMKAIALSEGVDSLANLHGVVIFRTIDNQRMAAVFDLAAIRAGAAKDPAVYGGDIIVVDQSGAKTALRRFIEVVPAFALFQRF